MVPASVDNTCWFRCVAAQTEDDCHGVLCAMLGPVMAGAYSQLRKLPIHMAGLYAHAGDPFLPITYPLQAARPATSARHTLELYVCM